MKIPKKIKKYCPKCKKTTEMNVKQAKGKGRSKAHPLTRYGTRRLKIRGLKKGTGFGNKNKYSKPAVAKFKRTGAKTSKKTDLRYTCKECKKVMAQTKGIRSKKVEFV